MLLRVTRMFLQKGKFRNPEHNRKNSEEKIAMVRAHYEERKEAYSAKGQEIESRRKSQERKAQKHLGKNSGQRSAILFLGLIVKK